MNAQKLSLEAQQRQLDNDRMTFREEKLRREQEEFQRQQEEAKKQSALEFIANQSINTELDTDSLLAEVNRVRSRSLPSYQNRTTTIQRCNHIPR